MRKVLKKSISKKITGGEDIELNNGACLSSPQSVVDYFNTMFSVTAPSCCVCNSGSGSGSGVRSFQADFNDDGCIDPEDIIDIS